jgi:DNA-binding LacI/PurR family transcriptional regulator
MDLEQTMPKSDDKIQGSPSIRHIASTLEARIRSGAYAGGRWLPPERALAEEFQVSRATLRHALKELDRRKLLVRTAGCRPLVVGGRSAETEGAGPARRSLGLWISGDPSDLGGTITARGVLQALDADAFRLVTANPSGKTQEEAIASEGLALMRMARDEDIAGILLWYLGGSANLPTLEALRRAQIPVVFVDRAPPDGFEADYVSVDNTEAAAAIVRHLLDMGHRSIAHLTNRDRASTVAERLAGYRHALEAAGIPYRPERVLEAPFMEPEPDRGGRTDDQVAEQLLGLPDRPTAVFAVNDYHALSLIAALRARGVRVPEDVVVAGFDDAERWTPGHSFLTTARQPFDRMGAEAVKLLLRRLRTPAGPYRHVVLDAPLVVRGSTGGRCSEMESSHLVSRKESRR